jgi:uncharacterized protein YndB with AHSA1/START domain
MNVDVTAEVIIQRPRAEVFRFVTDVAQDTLWTSGLLEAHQLTDGPFAAGTRIERTSKFLGRRFSYTIEIRHVEPDAHIEMVTTAGPFPMTIHYQLDDQAEGTRMRIRALGEPGGFFSLAAPLLGRSVRRQIGLDLETLKEVLESRS